MSVPTTTASPWVARLAYCAAGIFIDASGGINLQYDWAKGSDPITSLIWAAVAGAVAVVFALSWPALIRACSDRNWSSAAIALVAVIRPTGTGVPTMRVGRYDTLNLWITEGQFSPSRRRV
jgi:hypothetical protein